MIGRFRPQGVAVCQSRGRWPRDTPVNIQGDYMPVRVSETLIISDHFIAERIRRFGMRQWRVFDRQRLITADDSGLPWYAQTGHDAMAVISALEKDRGL